MLRLAHLSDPHLSPMPAAALRELMSKRAIGWLNWRLNRGRGTIDTSAREALVADLLAQAPDHIAVTGDLVNLALPAEFANARVWLDHLGPGHDVSLVPGNHDAYVPGALARAVATWGDHMRGDSPDAAGAIFPYVRRRGPVSIIGVSSAIATAPFMATGRVGPRQVEALRQVLASPELADTCRVVLIHHPPIDGSTGRAARLIDATAVRAAIAAAGAEIVLHGHTHRASCDWIAGPTHRVPVVGVPSAALHRSSIRRGAGWNCLDITRGPRGFQITRIERGFAPGESQVRELSRRILDADAG